MYTWIKYCIRCIVLCRGVGKQTDRFELNWNRYISRSLLLTLINDSACYPFYSNRNWEIFWKKESPLDGMASRINRVGSFTILPYLILTVFQLCSFLPLFSCFYKTNKNFRSRPTFFRKLLDYSRISFVGSWPITRYVFREFICWTFTAKATKVSELAFMNGSLGNWWISVWTFWAMVRAQNGGCSCFLPVYFILNGPFDMWTSGICSSYRPPPMRNDIFYGVDDIPWETYHHEIFLLFNNSNIMNIREYYRSIVTVSFISMIRLQHV